MKVLTLIFTLLSVSAFADVKILHPTCELSIESTYTDNGLNIYLTNAATRELSKKNFMVINKSYAVAETMAMKVDLKTSVNKKMKRGECDAVVSLRGQQDEMASQMLLVNTAKGKGNIKNVSGKCIADVIKALKDYPECVTTLDKKTGRASKPF